MNSKSSALFAALCGLFLIDTSVLAQGSAFTYQGQLRDGANAADGTYDLTFSLYPASTGGAPDAGPLTNAGVAVTNGLFTVTVDFGSTVWNGQSNWLEIGVRTNGGATFMALTPRQPMTPAPYAIFAATASNLSGSLPASQLPASVVTNDENHVTLDALTVVSNLELSATPAIFAGTNTLLRADGAFNFFAGVNAGNSNLTGTQNLGIGDQALEFCTNDNQEVAVGFQALKFDDGTNPPGWLTVSGNGENTAVGFQSMAWNTLGFANTAVGYQSMELNTTGEASTAIGDGALWANTTGLCNTAVGYQVMFSNSIGIENTAIGLQTMYANTTGSYNTAVGWGTMTYAVIGNENTACGYDALEFTTNDSDEVAVGFGALQTDNATNQGTASGVGENTAVGYMALASDYLGTGNSALGFQALTQMTGGINNTAFGDGALQSLAAGTNNIAVGYQAAVNITTGSNNIDIGNRATAGDNNTIRIGTQGAQTACYLAGTVYANGTFVSSSDRNAKENFKPVDAKDVWKKSPRCPSAGGTTNKTRPARTSAPWPRTSIPPSPSARTTNTSPPSMKAASPWPPSRA